jgi:hypothetical protein
VLELAVWEEVCDVCCEVCCDVCADVSELVDDFWVDGGATYSVAVTVFSVTVTVSCLVTVALTVSVVGGGGGGLAVELLLFPLALGDRFWSSSHELTSPVISKAEPATILRMNSLRFRLISYQPPVIGGEARRD